MDVLVKTPADFDAVEAFVARALTQQGDACNFTKSAPYILFRRRVLYRPDEGPLSVFPELGGLSLAFTPPDSVAVRVLENSAVQ